MHLSLLYCSSMQSHTRTSGSRLNEFQRCRAKTGLVASDWLVSSTWSAVTTDGRSLHAASDFKASNLRVAVAVSSKPPTMPCTTKPKILLLAMPQEFLKRLSEDAGSEKGNASRVKSPVSDADGPAPLQSSPQPPSQRVVNRLSRNAESDNFLTTNWAVPARVTDMAKTLADSSRANARSDRETRCAGNRLAAANQSNLLATLVDAGLLSARARRPYLPMQSVLCCTTLRSLRSL